MSKNGIWGGDLEINAISNCYKCNVVVYQDHRPNIELQNFPKENRVIRLAYFGSCHYNSVRGKSQIALSDHSTEGNIVIRKEEPSPSKPAADTSKSTSNLKSSELKKFAQLHDQKGIPSVSAAKSQRLLQPSKSQFSKPSKLSDSSELLEPPERSEPAESTELSQMAEALKQFEASAARLRALSISRQNLDKSWKRRIQTVLQDMEASFGEPAVETSETSETRETRETRETVETGKAENPSKQQAGEAAEPRAKKDLLSLKEIARRNLRIIQEFERRVKRANAHHVHTPGEWCGDLSFDDLVPLNMRLKLLFVPRERQVRGFLTLLTKKCPCHSGAYFKYCCYPKMKAW